jgi:hypothetical protein
MNTIKTFEDLQELGCNSIHENTHISRPKIEQVLNKSFGELTRVQFMGFISILEREYQLDLSSLREEYNAYVQLLPDTANTEKSAILQAQSHARRLWVIIALVGIILLVGIGWVVQGSLSTFPKEEVMQLSSTSIEVVDTNSSEMNLSDMNSTNDINMTEINATQLTQEQNKSVVMNTQDQSLNFANVLSIKPASKVWVGMMDLATGEKIQKVTKDPIVIDATKNWLFVFGHGRLEIVTSEGSKTIKERNTAWFAYENGMLQRLTLEQFKIKNKGSNW